MGGVFVSGIGAGLRRFLFEKNNLLGVHHEVWLHLGWRYWWWTGCGGQCYGWPSAWQFRIHCKMYCAFEMPMLDPAQRFLGLGFYGWWTNRGSPGGFPLVGVVRLEGWQVLEHPLAGIITVPDEFGSHMGLIWRSLRELLENIRM